jgi:hypothetical protein
VILRALLRKTEQMLIVLRFKISPEAIRDIYAGPNALPISDLYKRFGNREKGQMFVQEEPKHREKRKKIIHVFSKPSIAALEPVLHGNSAKLLAYIEKNKGSPVDLLFWDRMLNMDIAGKLSSSVRESGSYRDTGELFFGKSFGALDGDPVAKDYARMVDFAFLNYMLREIAGPILSFLKVSKYLLPKTLKDVAVSADYLDDVSDVHSISL